MKIALIVIVASLACVNGISVVDVTETTVCNSTQKAEVAFVLDGSSSITPTNWPKVTGFVKSIVESFTIGPENVRVSVILFSHRQIEAFPLDEIDNMNDMIHEIENLPYIRGSTFTNEALDMVRLDTLAPAKCRDDTPRIAIVFTDGRSRYEDETEESARLLRQSGVSVVAVGVKDAQESELIKIAGSQEHVRHVDSFDDMTTLTEPMTKLTCEESQKICETTQKAEIVFLIDGSSSVTPANWPLVLKLVSTVTGSFPVGQDEVRVAAALFSHRVQKEIGLADFSDVESIQEAIEHLPFIRGSTFTDLALNTACNDVLAVGEGKAREGVHKIVIVITDGRSRYYKDTLIEAAACRSDGVSLIAVGVGNANVEELEGIAGDPNKVYAVDDFEELMYLSASLKSTTCSEIRKIIPENEPVY